MFPRLILGAAAVSLAYLVLSQEHRAGKVVREYAFEDAEAGYELVNAVIDREWLEHGVESKLVMKHGQATLATSRRGHAALATALLARRGGFVAPTALFG